MVPKVPILFRRDFFAMHFEVKHMLQQRVRVVWQRVFPAEGISGRPRKGVWPGFSASAQHLVCHDIRNDEFWESELQERPGLALSRNNAF